MVLIPGLVDDLARQCLVRVCYSQICHLSLVCKAWKKEVHSHQFHLIRKKTCYTQKLIFVPVRTQEQIRFTFLEPETGVWSRFLPIPDGLPNSRPLVSCQVLGCNSSLFVVVLLDPDYKLERFSLSVYVFDIFTFTWRRGAGVSDVYPVDEGCTFDGDHMIYILCTTGPRSQFWGRTKSNWIRAYDIEKDEWNTCCECDGGVSGMYHRGSFHIEFKEDLGDGLIATSWRSYDVTTWQWKWCEEILFKFLITSFRVCDYNGDWYGCDWDCNFVALRDSECKAFAKLPDATQFWGRVFASKLVVISCEKHVWMQGNYVLLLDLENDQCQWKIIGQPPGELCVHSSASCLEI